MNADWTERTADKVPVLVSGCLLGQKVRFDGGHKHDRFVTDKLSAAFEFVSVCPEMAMGLGSPRPTLRLVQGDGNARLVPSKGDDTTPLLPVVDEGRLNDSGLREAFVERVFAYRRWVE